MIELTALVDTSMLRGRPRSVARLEICREFFEQLSVQRRNVFREFQWRLRIVVALKTLGVVEISWEVVGTCYVNHERKCGVA